VKGAKAERIAAAIIVANVLIATANYATARSQLIDLCVDALTALALLPITMRYASLWLGVVMLVYSLQFGLDAYYIVLERPLDSLHAIVNNFDSIAISVSLVAGTIMTWMRRRHLAAHPVFPEPPSVAL
jgi:signal transduction histidine kinase